MIARPIRQAEPSDEQIALWLAFVDHYTSSETRPAVDVFLRGLIGAPRV